jgi:hypothetical protein
MGGLLFFFVSIVRFNFLWPVLVHIFTLILVFIFFLIIVILVIIILIVILFPILVIMIGPSDSPDDPTTTLQLNQVLILELYLFLFAVHIYEVTHLIVLQQYLFPTVIVGYCVAGTPEVISENASCVISVASMDDASSRGLNPPAHSSPVSLVASCSLTRHYYIY